VTGGGLAMLHTASDSAREWLRRCHCHLITSIFSLTLSAFLCPIINVLMLLVCYYTLLWSHSINSLVVPATRRSSLGDRAFAVAGPRAWNSLPQFVTDCSSPLTFKKYFTNYFILFFLFFSEHELDCVAPLQFCRMTL